MSPVVFAAFVGVTALVGCSRARPAPLDLDAPAGAGLDAPAGGRLDAPASARLDAPAGASAPMSCAALQSCVQACPRAQRQACVAGCVARVSAAARPYYDALERCVAPACARPPDGGGGSGAPCLDPASFACKLCAFGHCATAASSCMAH